MKVMGNIENTVIIEINFVWNDFIKIILNHKLILIIFVEENS